MLSNLQSIIDQEPDKVLFRMNIDRPPLTFIDCSEQGEISAESVRFRIKSQAAFHAHAQRIHRDEKQALLSKSHASASSLRSASRRRTAKTRKPPPPGDGIVRSFRRLAIRGDSGEAGAEEDAEPPPLERAVLKPYTAPSNIEEHDWMKDVLNKCFSYSFPEYWHHADFDRTLGYTADRYINWLRFQAMMDPAVYFLACSAAAFFNLPKGGTSWSQFTWLRTQAVRHLNIALSDPSRMLSAITIFAVMLMACYETLNNPEAARNFHLPALRQMIAMKGGEERFGMELPGFMMIYIRWRCQEMTTFLRAPPVLTPWRPSDGELAQSLTRTLPGHVGEDLFYEAERSLEIGAQESLHDPGFADQQG